MPKHKSKLSKQRRWRRRVVKQIKLQEIQRSSRLENALNDQLKKLRTQLRHAQTVEGWLREYIDALKQKVESCSEETDKLKERIVEENTLKTSAQVREIEARSQIYRLQEKLKKPSSIYTEAECSPYTQT